MFGLVVSSLVPLFAVMGIYLANGSKVVERRKVKYLDPTHPKSPARRSRG
jgi:hypothetical protein